MFGFLKLIPSGVFAGVIGAMAVAIFFLNISLNGAKDDLATARANLDTAVEVNRRNVNAIETIKLINKQCIAERQADETRHANAVAAWNVERVELRAVANELRTDETIQIYSEPTCADFAKLNVNNVCPGLVHSLRQRTESNNRVRNSGSNGSGTDED